MLESYRRMKEFFCLGFVFNLPTGSPDLLKMFKFGSIPGNSFLFLKTHLFFSFLSFFFSCFFFAA